MTEKLFIKNPYMKEFEAYVQKVDGNKVILDRTAFFPMSGGQVGDTGYINKTRVIDTVYDEDKKTIIHLISGGPTFAEGDKVEGIIDWDRRYKIMRLHAASHIMEYFLFKVFGKLKLIGSHVNEKHDKSTYSLDGKLSEDKLQKVNDLVNDFIMKDYEIKRWEDKERKGWMYWEAGEIKMPCGGTHPYHTKEIGPVIIKRKSGGKGKEVVITKLRE